MRKTIEIQKAVDTIARFKVDALFERENYPTIADSEENVARELYQSLINVLYMTDTAPDYETAEKFIRQSVEKKKEEIYQQKIEKNTFGIFNF